ncbi:uncharacterized protein TRAVEDRAFT_162168 [Trametes versicolor FP-101664 SS1]|uniref:uncharacterized protein n=1 Tax=Trametes versicolor (strain FP-101664) TaxID=717944 RepID=UPI0004624680|nr:uncharacterized protein TRAVEDRAFT_162168 [Trametes versicolor FP-101664 SS1]EIW61215.1 hypothetical protein TRAVEDRAFT_162168 [Trametes versicolor FP-101664 SS1]
MLLHSILFCLVLQFSGVLAQFGFFEQMFGGHQQQQQRPAGGMGQWQAHSEAVPCSSYLCPDTLVCVNQPAECPCPDVQDVKCLIPDAQDAGASTVVCVRGREECEDVQRKSRKI